MLLMLKIFIIFSLFFSISASLAFAEEPSEGWERLANMPEPRSESNAIAHNNKIYVVGGLNNKELADNSMFVYDINENEWTIGTSMPTAIHHAGAAIYKEKLYVVGGYYDKWIPSNGFMILH